MLPSFAMSSTELSAVSPNSAAAANARRTAVVHNTDEEEGLLPPPSPIEDPDERSDAVPAAKAAHAVAASGDSIAMQLWSSHRPMVLLLLCSCVVFFLFFASSRVRGTGAGDASTRELEEFRSWKLRQQAERERDGTVTPRSTFIARMAGLDSRATPGRGGAGVASKGGEGSEGDEDNLERYELEAEQLQDALAEAMLHQGIVPRYDAQGQLVIPSETELADQFEGTGATDVLSDTEVIGSPSLEIASSIKTAGSSVNSDRPQIQDSAESDAELDQLLSEAMANGGPSIEISSTFRTITGPAAAESDSEEEREGEPSPPTLKGGMPDFAPSPLPTSAPQQQQQQQQQELSGPSSPSVPYPPSLPASSSRMRSKIPVNRHTPATPAAAARPDPVRLRGPARPSAPADSEAPMPAPAYDKAPMSAPAPAPATAAIPTSAPSKLPSMPESESAPAATPALPSPPVDAAALPAPSEDVHSKDVQAPLPEMLSPFSAPAPAPPLSAEAPVSRPSV